MEETIRLTKSSKLHEGRQRPEFIDGECSTDSGCSSGGSTGSAEHISRPQSNDRGSSFHRYRHRTHHKTTTQSQERLSRAILCNHSRSHKSSRSWSPSAVRQDCRVSPLYSSSQSDAQSTDSDSLNRVDKTEFLRRALQCLKLVNRDGKEKKHMSKSPKRILRKPVHYTYVKGISGLPTQRVPRRTVQ